MWLPGTHVRATLRQVSLALQQYCLVNGSYPPSFVTDKNGKPLYSWRVLVLPYLDQVDLFDAFNLDEAWDSPHNRPLSDTRINVFTCPRNMNRSGCETNFFAVVGPGTSFGWLSHFAIRHPRRSVEDDLAR